MLEFLNPLYLFGLSAAALPLLIHFFNKRKARIEKISSIQFLKRIENKNIRNVKLREYLLLLLRILIILLIVLSFSEPVVKTEAEKSSIGQKTTCFILIDPTYSLQYLLEEGSPARQRMISETEYLVNRFQAKGNVFLLIPGKKGLRSMAVTTDKKWQQVLYQLPWDDSRFEPRDIDNYIREFLSNVPSVNNYLFVLSDFQKRNNLNWLQTLPENLQTWLIPFPVAARKNTGITGLQLLSKILAPGYPMEIELQVQNYSERIDQDSRFFVKINDRVVLQKRMSLASGETNVVPVSFMMETAGWKRGEVILQSDELEADNHFYFTFFVPRQPRILVSSSGRTQLWDNIFRPLTDEGKAAIKVIPENELLSVDLETYDLVLMHSRFDLSDNEFRKIQQYSGNGKNLLIVPDFPVEESGLKQLLVSTELGRLKNIVTASDSAARLSVSGFQIEGFSQMPEPLAEQQVDFFHYMVLENDKNSRNLLSFQNGWPFLIADEPVYSLTADILPGSSDFTLKAVFLPFIYDLVLYLANPEFHTPRYYVNYEEAFWEMVLEKSRHHNLEIMGPRNKTYRIHAASFNATGELKEKSGLVLDPGFYQLKTDAGDPVPVSINPDLAESAWQSYSGNDLESLPVEGIISLNELPEMGERLNPLWELWIYLLILAVVLMVIEMVLSSKFKLLRQVQK